MTAIIEALAREKKQSVPMVTLDQHVGEMSAEETEETLTDPKTRVIKQVTVDDIKATDVLFDHLMGTAPAPRKKFIQEHSKEATYGV